ncbi:MAG: SIMPL domain-containing protein [Deltaproteobacteria bacterium]
MSNKIALALAALLLCAGIVAPRAHAECDKCERSTVEVTGRGEVKAKPDVAYLSLAVETTAKKASDAARTNAEKMKKVIDNLKALIGSEDKISTSGYQLYPIYEYNDKTKKTDLTGYRATNQAVVESRDLNNLGKLIDAATQVGANRVDGLSFGTNKGNEFKNEALVKATENARETATVVAKAAGVKLVKIIRIFPSYDVPVPLYKRAAVEQVAYDSASAAPTPIEPGEINVSATVNITFEIE